MGPIIQIFLKAWEIIATTIIWTIENPAILIGIIATLLVLTITIMLFKNR